jgi:ADP-ribose pyrophosphatase YjhB (NUDIX family)
MTPPTALAFSAFRRLPVPLRRLVVRLIAPTYVVGAVIVIRDPNGGVLLLRERHHEGWGLPGGLVQRGEHVAAAAVREAREEIGVDLDPGVLGPPIVNIDAAGRRVDVIFACTLDGLHPQAQEPEVLEARWFAVAELPELFEPTEQALRSAGVVIADAPH